jgi:hypothetical protein
MEVVIFRTKLAWPVFKTKEEISQATIWITEEKSPKFCLVHSEKVEPDTHLKSYPCPNFKAKKKKGEPCTGQNLGNFPGLQLSFLNASRNDLQNILINYL